MNWLPKRKILVPVDFSKASADAVKTALEMVDNPAHVQLLHVLFPLDNVSPGVIWGEVTDKTREERVREHFRDFLNEHSISGVSIDIRFGDPGLEIADYAKESGTELIVIPSHGYHGVKRFLLGSTAERVIRHAQCPILVLRRTEA